MDSTASLEGVTDHRLLCQFGDLVRTDCQHTASLLKHIDAIDRRQLWAQQGHPSMFAFLVSRYHMSESTAGKRIGAARTARRLPILFDMVARGEIHLSGIHLLKAHLTPANHEAVLAQAKHKSMRQIERLVAQLAPQPDVPSRLRALPKRTAAPSIAAAAPTAPSPTLAPSPTAAAPTAASPTAASPTAAAPTAAAPTAASPTAPSPTAPSLAPAPVPAPAPRRSPDPQPLAPGRYKLQVTLSEAARQKLKQLQDLLAHQLPNADPAAIVELAFDALLAQVHKRKTGITTQRRTKPQAKPQAKPQPKRRSPARALRTRHIPVAVRREVWNRDAGRCAFVGADGCRCNETRGLEFAHLTPWAKGGQHSVENIALRCMAHNAFEADRDYGARFMARKREREPLKVRECVARYAARGGYIPLESAIGVTSRAATAPRGLQVTHSRMRSRTKGP